MPSRAGAGSVRIGLQAGVCSESCAALELTAPLALTSGQAEYLVAESVQLVRDFPATHAALARGEIDERRARDPGRAGQAGP